jgi:hypothetical protein
MHMGGGRRHLLTPIVVIVICGGFTSEKVRSAFLLGRDTFVLAFSCVEECSKLGAPLGWLKGR